MKIAQILPRLRQGGVERGTAELSRELIARGHCSIVISEGGRMARDIENDGGRHITMPVAGKNPLTAFWRARMLRRCLHRLQPDIVHVRSRAPAWLLYWANKTLQLPVVSTVHGINHVGAYSRIMTWADEIICPSRAVLEHIGRHYAVPSEKITVIPRGVDTDYFNPAAADEEKMEELRRRHNLQGRRVALHVGRLTAQKGHEILIEAIARTPAADRWTALIVGDGKNRRAQRLRRQAAAAKAAVCFAGAAVEMREYYALSDVVLSCATKPESFGRTVAESFAMNTPVIAAAHGGVLDIVRNVDFARLTPPGDAAAMAAALQQPLPDARNARAHILENFTLRQMADHTVAVYKKLMRRRNSAAGGRD